jgi:hypothetical protein
MVPVMAPMSHPVEGKPEGSAARRAAGLLLRLHHAFGLFYLLRHRLAHRGAGKQRDCGGCDQRNFRHRSIPQLNVGCPCSDNAPGGAAVPLLRRQKFRGNASGRAGSSPLVIPGRADGSREARPDGANPESSHVIRPPDSGFARRRAPRNDDAQERSRIAANWPRCGQNRRDGWRRLTFVVRGTSALAIHAKQGTADERHAI